jgi:hypothetical protein
VFRPTTIAPLFFALSLSACAIPVALQPNQLSTLSKETTPTQLDEQLGKATVRKQVEFSANDQDYLSRLYLLQVGSRTQMNVMCTPTCFAYPTTVPVHSEYLIIQTLPSKALFAWGTPEALSKSADPAISSIMPLLKQKLKEKTEKKEK